MQLPCMADEPHICNYSGYAAAVHDSWLRCKQVSDNTPAKNAIHLMETMPEGVRMGSDCKTELSNIYLVLMISLIKISKG